MTGIDPRFVDFLAVAVHVYTAKPAVFPWETGPLMPLSVPL